MTWILIFVSMYLVELPDKTSLATLALVSRYDGRMVAIGSALAMVTQAMLAILAGRLLNEILQDPLRWIEIGLFAMFALWLWRESFKKGIEEGPSANQRVAGGRGRIISRAFLMVFMAEFLELTQMATMTYAARFAQHLVILFEVVATALVAANATVVVGGQRLRGLIATKWIQRSSATIFLMVAIAQAGIQILG